MVPGHWYEGSLVRKVDSPKCLWLKNILKIRQKGTCKLDLAVHVLYIHCVCSKYYE